MESTAEKMERHIRFDDFAFDTSSEELFRMGERVPMQPQPARLLALFLSKPGELLNREEIRAHIWPSTLVDYEQRISSAVRAIRTALDDDRANPRYIETVSRKGYRFIGFNRKARQEILVAWRWRVVAAAGAFILGLVILTIALPFIERGASGPAKLERTVLVILPVKDYSETQASTFPVEGLTNELIVRAAQIAPERLAVIARTSAMTFQDTSLSIAQIAEVVRADYVLESSLRQQGISLQITASLVDVTSEQNLWSLSYDRVPAELHAVELEIAQKIALSLGFEQDAKTPLSEATNPQAYEAYVAGLYLLGRGTGDDRVRSYALFQEAISHDEDFAPAYVGIARSASSAGRPLKEVRDAIEDALFLDDTLAEPYFLRARIALFRDWNWQIAARDFEAAVRLAPGRAEYRNFYALFLAMSGDYERALAENERALESDPLSGNMNADLGYLYLRTGHFERAATQCRRALKIDQGNILAYHCLMQASAAQGDLKAAAGHAFELMVLQGAQEADVVALRGLTAAAQIEGFWKWTLAFQLAAEPPNQFDIAFSHAALGNPEAALGALELALETHAVPLLFIGFDPRYDSLRDHPRFRRLIEAVGIPDID